jgi:ligand-binding SRPBCC domain-containing protein
VKVHILERHLWLSHPVRDVFYFFANALNLEMLTPPWLHFKVIIPGTIEMARGVCIDYRLRLRGLPLRWRSEITEWEPPHRFVDEQRRGPYKLWIHEHTFEDSNGGTLARDKVEYSVPCGGLVNRLLVARDLKKIFDYRMEILKEQFPHEP